MTFDSAVIPAHTMEMVVEFIHFFRGIRVASYSRSSEVRLKENLPDLRFTPLSQIPHLREYCEGKNTTEFILLHSSSHFFQYEPLYRIMGKAFYRFEIMGLTPEQLRAKFGFPDDLTEEERTTILKQTTLTEITGHDYNIV